jgi:hypothetical protein
MDFQPPKRTKSPIEDIFQFSYNQEREWLSIPILFDC